jgi:hypothetical protein
MLADDFIGCPALQALGRFIAGRDSPIRVKEDNGVIAEGLGEPLQHRSVDFGTQSSRGMSIGWILHICY